MKVTERISEYGVNYCSLKELVTASTGIPEEKLNAIKCDLTDIPRHTLQEVQNYGLTRLEAVKLKALLNFAGRYQEIKRDRIKITSSSKVFDHYKHLADLPHEEFHFLLLDKGNNVITSVQHTRGTIEACLVDVREIIRTALSFKAMGIILCHNHPSGNMKPSEADMRLTKEIKQAAAYFKISLLDHVIIGRDSGVTYYSFADEGQL